ncbi:MAG: hypothetical protein L0228_19110 [Planctomycetes bacterium]|nr:hypothetical protein [Planctomycetota bacterium]
MAEISRQRYSDVASAETVRRHPVTIVNDMNAEPLLNRIAKTFADHRFEAIMVGNAAAALHGAPVTTLDIDFMFRKTPVNLKKLKAIAESLQAVILKPYYPVSDLFRLINDEQGLQLDFMSRLHGIRSFEGLRSRATAVKFGERQLQIAALADIIKSKRATGRDRDLAVLPILEKTLNEQQSQENQKGPGGRSKEGN